MGNPLASVSKLESLLLGLVAELEHAFPGGLVERSSEFQIIIRKPSLGRGYTDGSRLPGIVRDVARMVKLQTSREDQQTNDIRFEADGKGHRITIHTRDQDFLISVEPLGV